MRNTSKAATLESKFPLLAIENDCIISKDADVTVCFKVRLPELFTVASAEYEAIHSAWFKAIKTLPGFAQLREQIRDIVHRSEHTDSAHSADSTEHAAAHAKQGALA